MTEDQLQRTVIEMARLMGLRVAHFRAAVIRPSKAITPVAADGQGYPDLTIVGPGGVMWRELKSARGRRSVPQLRWASALEYAGADYAVWAPADLASGRIERELRALRSKR